MLKKFISFVLILSMMVSVTFLPNNVSAKTTQEKLNEVEEQKKKISHLQNKYFYFSY